MEYCSSIWAPTDFLSHHGILGMKWGVRRYQNADGSLTPAGRKRYSLESNEKIKKKEENSKSSLSKSIKDKTRLVVNKSKEKMKDVSKSEIGKRGKAAFDVMLNGDTDWMGSPIYSQDLKTEIKNRGKAALERLMYSEEQINDKKFFGSYNPFD